LIIVINIFKLGINTSNIRVIIHVKAIYQIQNYSQESGQGEQNKQHSKAIVIIAAKK
jgi:superfamily II DNA helicase RecQ